MINVNSLKLEANMNISFNPMDVNYYLTNYSASIKTDSDMELGKIDWTIIKAIELIDKEIDVLFENEESYWLSVALEEFVQNSDIPYFLGHPTIPDSLYIRSLMIHDGLDASVQIEYWILKRVLDYYKSERVEIAVLPKPDVLLESIPDRNKYPFIHRLRFTYRLLGFQEGPRGLFFREMRVIER